MWCLYTDSILILIPDWIAVWDPGPSRNSKFGIRQQIATVESGQDQPPRTGQVRGGAAQIPRRGDGQDTNPGGILQGISLLETLRPLSSRQNKTSLGDAKKEHTIISPIYRLNFTPLPRKLFKYIRIKPYYLTGVVWNPYRSWSVAEFSTWQLVPTHHITGFSL